MIFFLTRPFTNEKNISYTKFGTSFSFSKKKKMMFALLNK